MAKVLYCKDVGFDCDFVARAPSEEKLLQEAAAHVEKVHGISELPEEVVAQVKAAIREEEA